MPAYRTLPRLALAAATLFLGAAAPASRPAAEALAGTLKTSSRITRIVAIDRAWADVLKTSQPAMKDDFVYPGTCDATTGAFRIDRLLPGRAYDLVIDTTDPQGRTTRWEGVSMAYHRPILPAAPATPEDRKAIEGLIVDPPQFYDKVRVLRIAADHQHAAVLVELKRTRDFHSDKGGEIIYRVELWYFENLYGGWAKDRNTEKVIARLRGKPGDFPLQWQFEPALGGLIPGADLSLALPDQPSAKHGLAGRIE